MSLRLNHGRKARSAEPGPCTPQLNSGTVQNDSNAFDTVRGGLGLDWLFGSLNDTFPDLNNGGTETVTGI